MAASVQLAVNKNYLISHIWVGSFVWYRTGFNIVIVIVRRN